MAPEGPVPFQPESLLEHSTWVHALARRLVRDDDAADDLTQETLLAALTAPPPEASGLRAWLAAVTRNRARSRYRSDNRRERREQRAGRDPAGGQPPTTEEILGIGKTSSGFLKSTATGSV